MLRTANLFHPASTQTSRSTPGVSLSGTLASPRTELSSAGCRELIARSFHTHSFVFIFSARAAGRTTGNDVMAKLEDLVIEDWRQGIARNLDTSILMTSAVIGSMKRSGWGSETVS